MGFFSKIFGKRRKIDVSSLPWSNESKQLFNQALDMYDEDFKMEMMIGQTTGMVNPDAYGKVLEFDSMCETICKNEGISKEGLMGILRQELN